MISELTYVEERQRAGCRTHYHDGIWWQQPWPLYAKPVFDFRAFPPGTARPLRVRALFGYSHQVAEAHMGNRSLEYMILEGEDLSSFSLDRLPAKKRNQVRKGLKQCEIQPLEAIESWLEHIREIYISQAQRHTEFHDAPATPPSFYVNHADRWRKRELRYLTGAGREVWGALVEGRLVGFLVSRQVEEVRVIEKVKSHSDYLQCCLSDGLYFTVLAETARQGTCRRVVNPGVRGGGLDRYKEQFLFKRTEVPLYCSNVALFHLGERLIALRKWRRLFRGTKPQTGKDSAARGTANG